MRARALVFDFDGLLLETEGPSLAAWDDVYRAHGHELPRDRWLDYVGREGGWFDALGHLAELVGEGFDRDAASARREELKDRLIGALDLMPGIRERVREAKAMGLRVGVASSASSRWVCGHLERLAFIAEFDAITCRSPELRAKPAPDLYLASVAALGVRPEEAVAIEDSRNGVAAAKAAGLRCVAVPNAVTSAQDLGQADLRLASLADLPLGALLARLGFAQ